MCLETKSFDTLKEAKAHKPLIATKDIPVWKALDENNRSPYRNFRLFTLNSL